MQGSQWLPECVYALVVLSLQLQSECNSPLAFCPLYRPLFLEKTTTDQELLTRLFPGAFDYKINSCLPPSLLYRAGHSSPPPQSEAL